MADDNVLSSEILRPYEKCIKYGAGSLNDRELLAVVIRTGTTGVTSVELAGKIFDSCRFNSGLKGLMNISLQELMHIKGIGKAKAVQILCICELSRRIAKTNASEKLDFSKPEAIADYYMEDLRHLQRERLILVVLDSKCRMVHDTVLSVGTINSSLVTPRETFVEALKYNGVFIVLIHNHPSGDATPSESDYSVTKRIKKAGEYVGIELLDHIIIGDNTFTSLREKNIL